MSTPKAPAKPKAAAKSKPRPKAKPKAKPPVEIVNAVPDAALDNGRTGASRHKPLSNQQAMFCEEYVKDFNGAAAARRAGYSENSAREQAYDLLTKPHIQLRVRQLRREAVAQVRFDKDKILERLSNELEADLADLYDENDQLLPVSEWPMVWRTGLVVGVETEELFEGTGENRVRIGLVKKIKYADRHKKIELAGKHVDVMAFKERSELDVTGTFAELLAGMAGTPLAPTQIPPVKAAPQPVALAAAAATNPDLVDDGDDD